MACGQSAEGQPLSFQVPRLHHTQLTSIFFAHVGDQHSLPKHNPKPSLQSHSGISFSIRLSRQSIHNGTVPGALCEGQQIPGGARFSVLYIHVPQFTSLNLAARVQLPYFLKINHTQTTPYKEPLRLQAVPSPTCQVRRNLPCLPPVPAPRFRLPRKLQARKMAHRDALAF